jgi:hypothetical protein
MYLVVVAWGRVIRELWYEITTRRMPWAHRLYFGLVGHGEGAGESRGGGRRIISLVERYKMQGLSGS